MKMKLNNSFISKLNKLTVEIMKYYKIYPEYAMVHSAYYKELGTRLSIKYTDFTRLRIIAKEEMKRFELNETQPQRFNDLLENLADRIELGKYGWLAPFFIVQTCIIHRRIDYLTEDHIKDINGAIKSIRKDKSIKKDLSF